MSPLFNPPTAISASNSVFPNGTVRITGGPNVTVGTDASGLSISGAAGAGIGAIQNSNTTYTSGTVNFVDLANITIRSTTGQKLEFSVANPGAGAANTRSWLGVPEFVTGSPMTAMAHNTLYLHPFHLDDNLTVHNIGMYLSGTGATGSTASASLSAVLYTLNASTLSSLSSASRSMSWSSGSGASSDWGAVLGPRRWEIGTTWNMTPGMYWLGKAFRTNNAGTFSVMANSRLGNWSGIAGSVSNTTHGLAPYQGMYTASVSTVVGSIAGSQINGNYSGNNLAHPIFYLANSAVNP